MCTGILYVYVYVYVVYTELFNVSDCLNIHIVELLAGISARSICVYVYVDVSIDLI